MRFLAAWFGDPIQYWPQILGLIVFAAVAIFIVRKIQSKRKFNK